MDKINKKFQNNKKLLEEFRLYFNKFSSIIRDYHEAELKTLIKTIDGFEIIINTVKKTTIDNPENFFIVVHYLAHLDNTTKKIKDVFEYFNPEQHRFTQEFSTTYLIETGSMFDGIIVLINGILKKHDVYDSEIIEFLGDRVVGSLAFSNILLEFSKLRSFYRKYRNSVSLYAYVSQKILDKLFSGEKFERVLAFKIMVMIEEDKNFELENSQLTKKYTNLKTNPPQLSFGLVPKTNYLPIGEIIQLAFGQSVSGTAVESMFDSIGKTNRLTIVVQKKISQKAAEYFLNNILEKSNYKHTAGINKDLVEKFTTIKTGKDYSSYKFQLSVYGLPIETDSNILITETIDLKSYRIMSSWSSPSFITDKKNCMEYIKYVKDEYIKKPRRAENYNNIMINKMTANMFLKRSVDVKKMSEISQVKEIKFLRNSVYTKMLEFYVDIMNKEYNEGKNIKDNKDLIKIINDIRIKDLFTEILVKNYYTYLKKNQFLTQSSNFVFTEVLSTFLANLQIIVRGFIREIYTNSEKYEPKNTLYQKEYPVIYSEIRDIFDKVLKKTLEKIMDDKSNIYQSLIYKTMIVDLDNL
jgi:hypothetical protein